MGFGEAFRKAIFVEPVMVWSLMMYASVVVPSIKPHFDKQDPKTPPSLKEVMAGIQDKLYKK